MALFYSHKSIHIPWLIKQGHLKKSHSLFCLKTCHFHYSSQLTCKICIILILTWFADARYRGRSKELSWVFKKKSLGSSKPFLLMDRCWIFPRRKWKLWRKLEAEWYWQACFSHLIPAHSCPVTAVTAGVCCFIYIHIYVSGRSLHNYLSLRQNTSPCAIFEICTACFLKHQSSSSSGPLENTHGNPSPVPAPFPWW